MEFGRRELAGDMYQADALTTEPHPQSEKSQRTRERETSKSLSFRGKKDRRDRGEHCSRRATLGLSRPMCACPDPQDRRKKAALAVCPHPTTKSLG